MVDKVRLGPVEVSRLTIGGNPFSGFSHQGGERDRQMKSYYTGERIKQALRKATPGTRIVLAGGKLVWRYEAAACAFTHDLRASDIAGDDVPDYVRDVFNLGVVMSQLMTGRFCHGHRF